MRPRIRTQAALALGFLCLCCSTAGADVLRQIKIKSGIQGENITAGIVVGDHFYFAGHTEAQDGSENQQPNADFLAGLFSPTQSARGEKKPSTAKKVVLGKTGRIFALERSGAFLLAASEFGLFKTKVFEDGVGPKWTQITPGYSDRMVVIDQLICLGAHQAVDPGYWCVDFSGRAIGPKGVAVPRVMASSGKDLWVGGVGFVQVHQEGSEKVTRRYDLGVDAAELFVEGILPTESSIWIRTHRKGRGELKSRPGPVFKISVSEGALAELTKYAPLMLAGKVVTSVAQIDDHALLGTSSGELFRVDGLGLISQVDTQGFIRNKAVTGIRQLNSGGVWLGTTKGSYLLDQVPESWARKDSVKPLLGVKEENEKINVRSVEESETLWFWGGSGIYELDRKLKLEIKTDSYHLGGLASILFGGPVQFVWGRDLKLDFNETFYFKNGARAEDTNRFVALPLETSASPLAIAQLSERGLGEPDDYAWAKVKHFSRKLGVFWPTEIELVVKDSFGNVSSKEARRYFPVFFPLQLGTLYVLASLVGAFIFLRLFSRWRLARRFWLRDEGKFFVFNRNWLLFEWAQRDLLVFYREGLRAHLKKSNRGYDLPYDDLPYNSENLEIYAESQSNLLVHCDDPERLSRVATATRYLLVTESLGGSLPLTPVEVNLLTAVKNEIPFPESAKMELHEFGAFFHRGVREQILNSSNMVFCISGIRAEHLTVPDPAKEDDESAKVYWALKLLFETYSTGHLILVFCEGKPNFFDSLGYRLTCPRANCCPASPQATIEAQ